MPTVAWRRQASLMRRSALDVSAPRRPPAILPSMSVQQPSDLPRARCPSWTIPMRGLVIALALAPFAALMIEIHRPPGMWLRIPAAGLPAVAILILLMVWDLIWGNRMLLRNVL